MVNLIFNFLLFIFNDFTNIAPSIISSTSYFSIISDTIVIQGNYFSNNYIQNIVILYQASQTENITCNVDFSNSTMIICSNFSSSLQLGPIYSSIKKNGRLSAPQILVNVVGNKY